MDNGFRFTRRGGRGDYVPVADAEGRYHETFCRSSSHCWFPATINWQNELHTRQMASCLTIMLGLYGRVSMVSGLICHGLHHDPCMTRSYTPLRAWRRLLHCVATHIFYKCPSRRCLCAKGVIDCSTASRAQMYHICVCSPRRLQSPSPSYKQARAVG